MEDTRRTCNQVAAFGVQLCEGGPEMVVDGSPLEDALLDALHAAEVAGLSLDEVEQMLKTLYLMNKEQ